MKQKVLISRKSDLDEYKNLISKSTYYRTLRRGYFWINYYEKEVVVGKEYPDWLQDEGIVLFAKKLANKYGWKDNFIDIEDYASEILLRWCELSGKREMNFVKYRIVVAKNACKSYYHDWYCGGSKNNGDNNYYVTLSEFIENSLNKNFWVSILLSLNEDEKQRIEKFLNGKASLPFRLRKKIQKLIGG